MYVSRTKRRNEDTVLDLAVIEVLDKTMLLNLPIIMIKHLAWATTLSKGKHVMSYWLLLTQVFVYLKVPVGEGRKGTKKDMFDRVIL